MKFENWRERFLKAASVSPSKRGAEFIELVDEVDGRCSLDVARVLMSSFGRAEDFGTQEAVVSVLASASKSDAIRAILEELPRLVMEAPEWADVLIGQEVERRPELLLSIVQTMSKDISEILSCVVNGKDFVDLYDNADSFAAKLR